MCPCIQEVCFEHCDVQANMFWMLGSQWKSCPFSGEPTLQMGGNPVITPRHDEICPSPGMLGEGFLEEVTGALMCDG